MLYIAPTATSLDHHRMDNNLDPLLMHMAHKIKMTTIITDTETTTTSVVATTTEPSEWLNLLKEAFVGDVVACLSIESAVLSTPAEGESETMVSLEA